MLISVLWLHLGFLYHESCLSKCNIVGIYFWTWGSRYGKVAQIGSDNVEFEMKVSGASDVDCRIA